MSGRWTCIAKWLNLSRSRQESVRCVMGYIVNLIMILDGMFRAAARNTMENAAQEAMGDHIGSGRRDNIHQDIRRFVEDIFPIRFNSQRYLVLEKIIDLIRQHCFPS